VLSVPPQNFPPAASRRKAGESVRREKKGGLSGCFSGRSLASPAAGVLVSFRAMITHPGIASTKLANARNRHWNTFFDSWVQLRRYGALLRAKKSVTHHRHKPQTATRLQHCKCGS
jgi:hypothetical protein